jgi:hypothetical protein
MTLLTIGQGPGSVATRPGPQTGGEPLPSPQGQRLVASGAPPSRGSDLDAAFARVAWFDVNGDGHIDNRSPVAGGDGTLLVPKHAVRLQLYSREVQRDMKLAAPAIHAEPTRGTEKEVAASDVQTRQAVDAYQRYGQPTGDAPTEQAVA